MADATIFIIPGCWRKSYRPKSSPISHVSDDSNLMDPPMASICPRFFGLCLSHLHIRFLLPQFLLLSNPSLPPHNFHCSIVPLRSFYIHYSSPKRFKSWSSHIKFSPHGFCSQFFVSCPSIIQVQSLNTWSSLKYIFLKKIRSSILPLAFL